jgi:hypothetical protein
MELPCVYSVCPFLFQYFLGFVLRHLPPVRISQVICRALLAVHLVEIEPSHKKPKVLLQLPLTSFLVMHIESMYVLSSLSIDLLLIPSSSSQLSWREKRKKEVSTVAGKLISNEFKGKATFKPSSSFFLHGKK